MSNDKPKTVLGFTIVEDPSMPDGAVEIHCVVSAPKKRTAAEVEAYLRDRWGLTGGSQRATTGRRRR